MHAFWLIFHLCLRSQLNREYPTPNLKHCFSKHRVLNVFKSLCRFLSETKFLSDVTPDLASRSSDVVSALSKDALRGRTRSLSSPPPSLISLIFGKRTSIKYVRIEGVHLFCSISTDNLCKGESRSKMSKNFADVLNGSPKLIRQTRHPSP